MVNIQPVSVVQQSRSHGVGEMISQPLLNTPATSLKLELNIYNRDLEAGVTSNDVTLNDVVVLWMDINTISLYITS